MAVIGLLTVAALGYIYADSLVFLFGQWGRDDYSHGPFIPFISAVLIWQRRTQLAAVGMSPSWAGPVLVAIGLLLFILGDYATLYILLHLSLWIVIVGIALSFIGLAALRVVAFPLSYLLTAIPLPVFLYNTLSSQLQLWSSALGVGFLQAIGVTAFREGNVIDLGPVQLQVAEACSGIRYLFPLTALALLCAHLYRDRLWKRIALVVSALPVSIFINGLRIGIVGVLVEWYGP
ncbi:MAG: exosortase, partial [Nitrospira sp.]|nr:exosortase [Nitrospira sp.]